LEFTGKWTAISDEFNLPPLDNEGDRTGKWVAETVGLLSNACRIVQEYGPQIYSEAKELLPHGVDARSVADSKAGAVAVAEAIKLNLGQLGDIENVFDAAIGLDTRRANEPPLHEIMRSGHPAETGLSQGFSDNKSGRFVPTTAITLHGYRHILYYIIPVCLYSSVQ
jgi:hypothetical protein